MHVGVGLIGGLVLVGVVANASGQLMQTFLVPLLGLVDHMNRLFLEVVVRSDDAFLVEGCFNAKSGIMCCKIDHRTRDDPRT